VVAHLFPPADTSAEGAPALANGSGGSYLFLLPDRPSAISQAKLESKMTSLRRIILTFKGEEISVHVLYQSSEDLGPNTKKRLRHTTELVREGLREAIESLDSEAGRCMCVGTSGFTQREDVLLVDTMPKGA
jgi:hypothetical protein